MHNWGGAVRAAVALVLALSIAACSSDKDEDKPKPNGIEELSVGQALREVRAAARDLDDVWLSGRGAFDFGTGVRRMEATFIVTPKGCSIGLTAKAVGEIQLKLVRKTLYFHADAKGLTTVFKVPATQAARAHTSWFSRSAPADIVRACDVLQALSLQSENCKRGKEGDVGDTPSIAFKCTFEGRPTTLHVSTVDEPLVLRVVGTDKEGAFDLHMVDHDTGYVLEAPRKGDVIDLAPYL